MTALGNASDLAGGQSDADSPPPWSGAGVAPEQLRCPHCAYILVGLLGTRCPECGKDFDWATVVAYARTGWRLPIEQAKGWRRLVGAARTFGLVLFRPWAFARLPVNSSIWPATAFALVCMGIGLLANALVCNSIKPRDDVAWIVGVWFHVECQSLVFCLLDLHFDGFLSAAVVSPRALAQWLGSWLRRLVEQWSFWRKVSLYTTAFVALDWAGPPLLESWTRGGNFPWILRVDSWSNPSWDEILRGVAYYWWMAVLVVILWIRLRRKWALLVILSLMPLITMASCRVAYEVTELIW